MQSVVNQKKSKVSLFNLTAAAACQAAVVESADVQQDRKDDVNSHLETRCLDMMELLNAHSLMKEVEVARAAGADEDVEAEDDEDIEQEEADSQPEVADSQQEEAADSQQEEADSQPEEAVDSQQEEADSQREEAADSQNLRPLELIDVSSISKLRDNLMNIWLKSEEVEAKNEGGEAKIDEVESKVEAKIDEVESKIDKVESKVEAKIDEVEAKIDEVEAKIEPKIEANADSSNFMSKMAGMIAAIIASQLTLPMPAAPPVALQAPTNVNKTNDERLADIDEAMTLAKPSN